VKISADNARRLCWMLIIWLRTPGDPGDVFIVPKGYILQLRQMHCGHVIQFSDDMRSHLIAES